MSVSYTHLDVYKRQLFGIELAKRHFLACAVDTVLNIPSYLLFQDVYKRQMLHRTVKENDVNKDKWIGVGGHFEYGESPEECLLREVKLSLIHI